MALLATLQEPFTGTTTPSGWTEFTGGSATFSYTSTGASVVFPASTSAATDGDLTTNATYNLTGSFARLNVTSVPGASATNTDAVLRVRQNSANYVTIFYEAGTLYFSKVVASVQTNIASVTYNATNHAWWQIKESGGVTHWQTSSDGKTWVTQTSQANPITITAVNVLIGGLCFGVDASPSNFTFRYFNYPLPGTTTSTSSTSSTSSSTSSTSTSTTSLSTSTTSVSTSSTSSSVSSTSSSTSTSSTSSSISSTSSSTSSTSSSSTSSSTSVSSTSSSISSTSTSSTSTSSTSSSSSVSSISTSFSSTSSSVSSTSRSTSSTSFSSTSSSSSTSTTTVPPPYITYSYQDASTLPTTGADNLNLLTADSYAHEMVDDADYFIQYGSEYMVQEFKRTWTNNTDTPTFTWNGRTTYDTRVSPIYIQIFNNQVSTSIMDSYSETNKKTEVDLATGVAFVGTAQSFTGNGGALKSAKFYVKRTLFPTGNMTAKVYAHSGVFGTSSIPTGAALATSRNFDVANLTTSFTLTELTFDKANQITLTNGTNYCVTLEYSGGDGSNYVAVGCDTTSSSHAGNESDTTDGSTWSQTDGMDLCFYVITDPWETLAVINTLPPDTDFQISVTQSTNLSNYYDSNNVVTFRVYQQVL